jgi:lipid-A-disaccharide synthase
LGALTAAAVRPLITASSAVLANLLLDEKAFPELMQEYCTPANLASALAPVLDEGPARTKQLAALARIPQRMRLPKGTPSEAAAEIVLHYAEKGRGWPHPDLLGRDA